MLYNIYAGLGGGFGGATYVGTLECKNENVAYSCAHDLACDEYDSYSGMYSLFDEDNARLYPEDYGLDKNFTEDDIKILYYEDRESWIDYRVIEADKDINISKEEREML